MLLEFGLLYVFRALAGLKENNSLRPTLWVALSDGQPGASALSDGSASINYGRREDEESDYGDNWVNLVFNSRNLCLR